MSEAELTVPRLGLVRAEPGLPAGRGDEPVRRGRHRADLLGDLRPHLPDLDGLPVRGHRVGDRRAALPRRTTAGGRRSSTSSDVPAAHEDVRIGSSVRGAIDLVAIAARLVAMRAVPADDWHAGLDAALVSLSGRIRMHESAGRRPEEVVRELYERVFGASPAGPDPDGSRPGGSLSPPPTQPAGRPQQRSNPKADAARNRTVGRSTLARHARFAEVSPEVGRARRAGAGPGAGRRPGRRRWRWWPTWCTPPTSRCGRRPGGSPPGWSSTGRGRAARSAPVRRDRGTCRPPGRRPRRRRLHGRRSSTARGERRPPDLDELTARDWGRQDLAVCLLVDASGSMSGERLAVAATVTGGLRAAGTGPARGARLRRRRPHAAAARTAPSRPRRSWTGCWRCAGTGSPGSPTRCGRRPPSWPPRGRSAGSWCCSRTAGTPTRTRSGGPDGPGAGRARARATTATRRPRSPRRPAPGGPSSPAPTARPALLRELLG